MTAQTKTSKNLKKGFTLIELLVVIGILAVLLAITLIAINPARQFEQARNTERSSDVNAILNAVGQYSVDGANQLITIVPASCDSSNPCEISDAASAAVGDDFCTELVPNYIAALPTDPQTGNGDPVASSACQDATTAEWNTGYQVYIDADTGRVTVSAPSTEPLDADATNDISVTR